MAWRMGSDVSEVRRAFLADHARGLPLDALLETYDISKSSAYALLKRSREMPLEKAVAERSRAPHTHPNILGNDVVRRVLRLKKRYPQWGSKKLPELYVSEYGIAAPSSSSIHNILKIHGMTRINRKRGIHRESQTMTQAMRVNDVWSTDHKGKMSAFGVEPLTVIDLYSRYWLACRPSTDKSYHDTRTAFEELFDTVGMPLIIRIDAGQPWASPTGPLRLSKLSAWWVALGLHVEIAPSCQENGCVERLHGTMQRDMNFAANDVDKHFEKQRRLYNNVRPHEALNMATPSSIYQKSQRKPIERIFDPTALGCDESRQVQCDGTFYWKGDQLYLSKALAGRKVGLQRQPMNTWTVHYYELELGSLSQKGFKAN